MTHSAESIRLAASNTIISRRTIVSRIEMPIRSMPTTRTRADDMHTHISSCRFHWGPVAIGGFATALGIALAFVQSVVIRFLVPRYICERSGILLGLGLHSVSLTLFGFSSKAWQLYSIIPLAAFTSVSDLVNLWEIHLTFKGNNVELCALVDTYHNE